MIQYGIFIRTDLLAICKVVRRLLVVLNELSLGVLCNIIRHDNARPAYLLLFLFSSV
jgi:hypothetical protein